MYLKQPCINIRPLLRYICFRLRRIIRKTFRYIRSILPDFFTIAVSAAVLLLIWNHCFCHF